MAATLEYKAGATSADLRRLQDWMARIRARHVTVEGYVRKFAVYMDPEYPAWKADFNAHFYYDHSSDLLDKLADGFIIATGVAVGGGIAATLAGGGAAAGATATATTTTASTGATAAAATGGSGITLGGIATAAGTAVKVATGAIGLASTAKGVLGSLSGHDPSAQVVGQTPATDATRGSTSTLVVLGLLGLAALVLFRASR